MENVPNVVTYTYWALATVVWCFHSLNILNSDFHLSCELWPCKVSVDLVRMNFIWSSSSSGTSIEILANLPLIVCTTYPQEGECISTFQIESLGIKTYQSELSITKVFSASRTRWASNQVGETNLFEFKCLLESFGLFALQFLVLLF